jgi:hypothetical protein
MTASKLLGPALRLIRRASVSRSSEVQSVGIATGTSSYRSKAIQFGFPILGILVSGCCERSTSITGRPVLVRASCGNKTPLPSRSVAKRTAARAYHQGPSNCTFVQCASAAAYTPHGLTYNILHNGIVLAIYTQV